MNDETIVFTEESVFLQKCPYHMNTQCYDQCPPGTQAVKDPLMITYSTTTCVNCWDLGFHGWKNGKCHSACPIDMVS